MWPMEEKTPLAKPKKDLIMAENLCQLEVLLELLVTVLLQTILLR